MMNPSRLHCKSKLKHSPKLKGKPDEMSLLESDSSILNCLDYWNYHSFHGILSTLVTTTVSSSVRGISPRRGSSPTMDGAAQFRSNPAVPPRTQESAFLLIYSPSVLPVFYPVLHSCQIPIQNLHSLPNAR